MYGVMSFTCICACIIGLGLQTYGLLLCATPNLSNAQACAVQRQPKMTLTAVGITLETILLAMTLISAWTFSAFRSAFGVVLFCDSYIEKQQQVESECQKLECDTLFYNKPWGQSLSTFSVCHYLEREKLSCPSVCMTIASDAALYVSQSSSDAFGLRIV